MRAAANIRERSHTTGPRGAMIDMIVRSLPWYFEMDLVAANILRKRLNGYVELEKATRCLNVS